MGAAGAGRPRQRGVAGLLRRRAAKVVIDLILLVGFVAEFLTREGPDYAVHSWIGIVLVPVLAGHLLGNLGWIRRVAANRGEDREWPLARFNAVFGVLAAVCILTGFPVWLDWSTSPWDVIHTMTGFAAIVLMFSHLWRNRSRIRGLARGLAPS